MLFQTDGAIVGDVNSEILSEESYESLLNQGTGVMGSIEIPKIGVDLPIYHGTDDDAVSYTHLNCEFSKWTSRRKCCS